MANLTVSIDRVKLRAAQDRLRRAGQSLDANIVLNLIGARIIRWIDQNFRAKGLEQPWPALSPNTIAARLAENKGTNPLMVTGEMRRSANYVVMGKTAVRIGFSDHKAEWHHFGTRPHSIQPRNAQLLAFVTTGGRVFAKHVKHPGNPPRRLLPSPFLGQRLAHDVLDGYVRAVVRLANGAGSTLVSNTGVMLNRPGFRADEGI